MYFSRILTLIAKQLFCSFKVVFTKQTIELISDCHKGQAIIKFIKKVVISKILEKLLEKERIAFCINSFTAIFSCNLSSSWLQRLLFILYEVARQHKILKSCVELWFLHALQCKDVLVLSYLHFSYSEQKNCSLYVFRGLSKLCNDFNDRAVKHNFIKKEIIIKLLWKEKFAFFVLLKLGSFEHLVCFMRRNIHAIYQKYIKIAHKTEGKIFKAISYFLLFF